ncbi:MAG: hypothetical protein ABEJ61_02475 [Haloferacaceae archaeon]
MFLLQIPGGPELPILLVAVVLNVLILIGLLGGLGYFLLRIRSGGSVDERLDRIERKIGRLEAQVEHLATASDVELAEPEAGTGGAGSAGGAGDGDASGAEDAETD